MNSYRVLVVGLVMVLCVMGIALIEMTIGHYTGFGNSPERVNALANSVDACVNCHKDSTPGIINQYGYSSMAAVGVTCQDCHEVEESYPGSENHMGQFYILTEPTPAVCAKCHSQQVQQYNQSRHSAPAWAAMRGLDDFTPQQVASYQAIPEGTYAPDKTRSELYGLEGPEITQSACERCHDIGEPHADGSIGQCQSCHLRHEFSLEQVRKPETCNACHIGPDHPQYEIYQESPHGIEYATSSAHWNWNAEPGTLTVNDFSAPTCAVCHMSAFGSAPTTHDVGDRLSWYLFAPVSEKRPDWETNRTLMQGVCAECHSDSFIRDFYTRADGTTERVNELVLESRVIFKPLQDAGLITPEPFDQPIDFTIFDLWHHWGRTTKFGAWMQGPDYSQWHGAYELLREMATLRDYVSTQLPDAVLPPVSEQEVEISPEPVTEAPSGTGGE
ncbi:MAG: multiheme c-type cytochrome [bacterium]|nr:multiheme c-type cytochrome [bacterium]